MSTEPKAKPEAKEEGSKLGRTVVYMHADETAQAAGQIIYDRGDGVVNIDCTATNGKRFVVENVPHAASEAAKTSAHKWKFTGR